MATVLHRFAEHEIAIVRAQWGKLRSEDIGRMINRSSPSVRVAARKLGLPMLKGTTAKSRWPDGWTDPPLSRFRKLGPPPSEPELERAVDVLTRMRNGWMTAVEERYQRAHNGERCICGRPGLPWCPEHRAFLKKEGML